MDNIKDNASFLDMDTILEQKIFLEKKVLMVFTLEIQQEEESNEEKIFIVHNPRSFPRSLPIYISMKVHEKITHFCLVDGGSGPNIML